MRYHQILSTFDGDMTIYYKVYKILIDSIKLLDEDIKYICEFDEDNKKIIFMWNNIQCSIVFSNINFVTYIFRDYTDEILEYIDLAKQLASEKGYEWIEDSVGGVTYYQVIDNSKEIKGEVF